MDVLLPIILDVTGNAAAALDLLEQQTVTAHGYAALHLSGFLHRRALTAVDSRVTPRSSSRDGRSSGP